MSIYRNNFSLHRTAAIRIGKTLWAGKLLEPLKFCMDNRVPPYEELVRAIERQIDKFLVREEVREELLFVVAMMGRSIWSVKRKFDRVFDDNTKSPIQEFVFTPKPSVWVDYISWSNNGCVDYRKTVEALYRAEVIPLSIPTWVQLCYTCLNSCLRDCFLKMAPEHQVKLYKTNYAGLASNVNPELISVMLLLAYWNIRHISYNDIYVINLYAKFVPRILSSYYAVEENMFIFSFITAQSFACEYFWDLLNAGQQRRAFATVCGMFYADGPCAQAIKKLFFTEPAMESRVLVFFLNLLSFYGCDDIRIRILGSGFVLERLLDWPYSDTFLETVQEAALHHTKINYNPIVLKLCTTASFCSRNQFIRRDFHYRKILYALWEMNPRNLKTSVAFPVLFKMMWRQQELEIISFFLSDVDLMPMRKMFLFALVSVCEPNEIGGDFYQTFTAVCLDSDTERNWFRAKVMVKAPTVAAVNGF